MNRLNAFLARATARYMKLIDYFVPEGMKADREAANQARMFLISHTMGPILGNTVPLALCLFDPTPGWDVAVLAVSITAFWIYPFLLRRGVAYHTLVLSSVVNLNFCILWSCYFYGGVASPTLPWVLVIPILSLFYIGGRRKLQPHLLAISAISFAIFLAAYLLFPPAANDMPRPATIGLGTISTVAALCYVATMAIYYARIFDAGVEFENEVARRKIVTDELRQAVVEADRAGAAKAEFLARMSHELRTPLNSIIGYGQILRDEATDADDSMFTEDVDRILDAGGYLLRLITMILDLSKIEAGRMKFDVSTCRLKDIVEAAIETNRAAIEANGNTVTYTISESIDTIDIDESRILQVIDTIVENAARFTRNGQIALVAEPADTFADPPTFALTVTDTGCGIEPELIPTLFKTFATTRDASDGRYGGTGLKLAVTGYLCQAMGGRISVKSAVDEGSAFTIVLPVRPAEVGGIDLPVARPDAGSRALPT